MKNFVKSISRKNFMKLISPKISTHRCVTMNDGFGNWADQNCKAKRRIVCELITQYNSFFDKSTLDVAKESLKTAVYRAYLNSLEQRKNSCPDPTDSALDSGKCKVFPLNTSKLNSLLWEYPWLWYKQVLM